MGRGLTRFTLAIVSSAVLTAGCYREIVQARNAAAPSPAELARASLHGKYSRLVETFTVPEDVQSYGDVHDYGYWPGGTYKGEQGLPAGWWVYLAPTWYIWRDSADSPNGPPPPPSEEAPAPSAQEPSRPEGGAPAAVPRLDRTDAKSPAKRFVRRKSTRPRHEASQAQ